ncbi:uncharacterized protein LOC119054384 [Artibeus jamaicensis]|uniref:uncharacterized protein LOC119054384 n=1 Tax=Artibeus jamaicensis TaxID=9417 RepID=UPI00235AB25E|nr:uncharacterized protein LOC119054384 [Artibeus jamaicensis]
MPLKLEGEEVNGGRGTGREEEGAGNEMGEGKIGEGGCWRRTEGAGMGRGQRGHKVRSPRAAASLPARRHRQQAGGLRNSPAFSPALPFSGWGGGDQPGQRGSQRRLLRAGPWLLSFGRRRQRRRQRSDPCGHHRPQQHALASRAPQQPPAAMAPVLSPPAPGTLQRPQPGSCALRLRAAQPTRRAPPPPKSARAPAITHNRRSLVVNYAASGAL